MAKESPTDEYSPKATPTPRTAYDRGRSEAREAHLAATREALARVICAADEDTIDYERCWPDPPIGEPDADGYRTDGEQWEAYLPHAEAILASGIIRDERLVKAEALNDLARDIPGNRTVSAREIFDRAAELLAEADRGE